MNINIANPTEFNHQNSTKIIPIKYIINNNFKQGFHSVFCISS